MTFVDDSAESRDRIAQSQSSLMPLTFRASHSSLQAQPLPVRNPTRLRARCRGRACKRSHSSLIA
ncbi:hypothetical protein CDN98_13605 [Roseateles terrae]|uniref:Uncharacterized protein n=1 Tax=Roseateles terrae TaxID=431060 RepID=A0ABR6GSE9_9BURK|nr:hypothetical protein [Roseateles terrae]OWQ85768.1 hypothetical protein CDN98_13605 [Roseateles terrae]